MSNSRKIKVFQLLKSVLGAFIGVQSDRARVHDFNSASPLPFIITGLLLALTLVGGLILLVQFIS